jgi:hypothetical protein
MFKLSHFLFCTMLIFVNAHAQRKYKADELQLELDNSARLTALRNLRVQKNYLSTDTTSALLTIVSGGKRFAPAQAQYLAGGSRISLRFPQGFKVDIAVREKNTHLVFEIIKAEPASRIDAVIWGPYPTTISSIVGEVIGVVREKELAIGMQVLNIKTLGGALPNNEGSTFSRGLAAEPRPWGSLIQAYSINRDKPRVVDAWNGQVKQMPVAALKGETVVGSKIALFSCQEPSTLDRIEQIELAEGLPHPTIKGVWFKKSPYFNQSYLISSFSEKNVDSLIGYTRKAGLMSLYHPGPFNSWGHFILDKKDFPTGWPGMKACVDKARQKGILMGVHMLSNFINTNDPYITPVPDRRLSVTGTTTVEKEIDAAAKEIVVASPDIFRQTNFDFLHSVKIGDEIIRYKKVSDSFPYTLMDCQRGAFGTRPSAHAKGSIAGKLFDHPYNVFYPDIHMQREMAGKFADFLNQTGVQHFDFDGHEGGLASGHGDYALELFARDVLDKVKHEVICGTSNSKTFYWHSGSLYNWGEPWYGGFRESMQQYRIDNQALFARNYMPHMLGWYLMTEGTSMEEMEWMLARAAGYAAGFALVANPNALRGNPDTDALMDAIHEWEFARHSNSFSDEQRERMKNPKKEFHLQRMNEQEWQLTEYHSSPVFIREFYIRQPGEPTATSFEYQQTWNDQPLQLRVYANGREGSARDIRLVFDNYNEITIPVELKAGESLVCNPKGEIRITNARGRLLRTLQLTATLPNVSKGLHKVVADCTFSGEEPPKIEIQFRGAVQSEMVKVKKS